MLNFAPNIFVMQYLEATGQVTEEIKTKAVEFMRTGTPRDRRNSTSDFNCLALFSIKSEQLLCKVGVSWTSLQVSSHFQALKLPF